MPTSIQDHAVSGLTLDLYKAFNRLPRAVGHALFCAVGLQGWSTAYHALLNAFVRTFQFSIPFLPRFSLHYRLPRRRPAQSSCCSFRGVGGGTLQLLRPRPSLKIPGNLYIRLRPLYDLLGHRLSSQRSCLLYARVCKGF